MKACSLFLLVAAVLLCSCTDALAPVGLRLHGMDAYHDALYRNGGDIAFEGYYLGGVREEDRTYVLALSGAAFECGNGVRFVLEDAVSVFVATTTDFKPLPPGDAARGMPPLSAALADAHQERDRVRGRHPLLFSSQGCRRQETR